MSVTIKKIAEVSGVSRGTVDRVLNNRGKVNKETEEKVREYAKMLGYRPNLAGKALAARKKGFVVGVVIPSDENHFFDEMLEGISIAAKNYSDYGIKVVVKTMKGYEINRQLEMVQELQDQISALIITPIDHDQIRDKINELVSNNIQVITLNTDINDTKRMVYVGTDYYSGGTLAAGMITLACQGKATIGIVQGSTKIYGHKRRLEGFEAVLPKPCVIKSIVECQDDDFLSYEETQKMLHTNPDIDTIFVVAAGVYGVCRAVKGLKKNVSVFCFDEIETTCTMLKEGVIKATLTQQPKYQGKKAVEIICDYLITGEAPLDSKEIVEYQIKIKEHY